MKATIGGARSGPVAIRGPSSTTLAAVALLVQQAACGGSTASGQSSPESNPGPGENVQPTSLTVHGLVRGPNGVVVPGAQVCLERGTSDSPVACSSSGPDGSFAVSDAEPSGSAALAFRASGFLPMLYPLLARAGDVAVAPIDSTLVEDRGALLGVATDPTKGQVPFVVTTSGSMIVPSVSATSTVLDDFAGFAGPAVPAVYGDANGSAVSGATTGPMGAFVNLSPGTYALKFEFVGALCTAGVGMPGAPTGLSGAASVFYTVVRAGYVMAPVVVACFVP